MQLTCPHCQFTKEVADDKLPLEPTRVTCPQCKKSFSLPLRGYESLKQPQITCPACGVKQSKTDACSSCGLIFAKYRPPQQSDFSANPGQNEANDPADKPKAGFWPRLVALIIDGVLIFLLQIIFSILLLISGSNGFHLQDFTALLVQLFSIVLSLFYWIFFTGYCGQTPGKMLLRIQVIRLDGSRVGYGRAFYREVVGKFISGIIFGIGYLMAAFDDQKQALHDRMAKTYVVKL